MNESATAGNTQHAYGKRSVPTRQHNGRRPKRWWHKSVRAPDRCMHIWRVYDSFAGWVFPCALLMRSDSVLTLHTCPTSDPPARRNRGACTCCRRRERGPECGCRTRFCRERFRRSSAASLHAARRVAGGQIGGVVEARRGAQPANTERSSWCRGLGTRLAICGPDSVEDVTRPCLAPGPAALCGACLAPRTMTPFPLPPNLSVVSAPRSHAMPRGDVTARVTCLSPRR